MTKEELFSKNMRLAYYICQKYYSELTKSEFEDLQAEATEALWRACLYFDESKGFKFSTFAGVAVSRAVKKYIVLKIKPLQATTVSINTPVAYDGSGNECTLADTLSAEDDYSRSQAEEILRYVTKTKHLKYRLQGLTTAQIGKIAGVSQSYTSRLMQREKAKIMERIG